MIDQLILWFIKLTGALLGATLSLLFQPPKDRTELKKRGTASVIVSMAYGGQLHAQLASTFPTLWRVGELEHTFGAYVMAALLAWVALGLVFKAAEKLGAVMLSWLERLH